MVLIPLLQTSDSKASSSPNFSRWVSIELLLEEDEMAALLKELEPVHLLSSTPLNEEQPFYLKKDSFLKAYRYYIGELKEGRIPDPSVYKAPFHFFLSRTLEEVYRQEVYAGKEVLKVNCAALLSKPVALQYSKVDHSIRVGPLNPQGILWGLQVSFPGLIQKPGSHEILPVNPKVHCNAALFKSLRGWTRAHTQSVGFEVNGKALKLPIRLGKNCLSWISNHPQLKHYPELTIL